MGNTSQNVGKTSKLKTTPTTLSQLQPSGVNHSDNSNIFHVLGVLPQELTILTVSISSALPPIVMSAYVLTPGTMVGNYCRRAARLFLAFARKYFDHGAGIFNE